MPELLQQISNRYQTAVAFHKESAELFYFLALPGFSALHSYQYYDEAQTQLKVKQYIIDNYGVVFTNDPPNDVNILEPLSYDKKRLDLTSNDKWNAVQSAWEAYYSWEISTKKEYESIAQQLIEEGEAADFQFVTNLVCDVTAEIKDLSQILSALQGMDYDLPTITSMQLDMQEKWEKKKRHLFR